MTSQESPTPNPAELMPAWEALVEKALGGASFDRKLVTHTYDGLQISPLYGPHTPGGCPDTDSGLPGQFPYVRGRTALSTSRTGWDVRQLAFPNDPQKTNQLILEDLAGGVSSIELDLWDGQNSRLDTLDELEKVLDGVHLEMAPIALKAGPHFLAAATQLVQIWNKRGLAKKDASGGFGADPLGTLARGGYLPDNIDALNSALVKIATFSAKELPQVRSVSIDLSAYHEAGASNTQCLAFAMATGVAYLRTLTDSGLTTAEAASEIAFHVPLDAEFFSSIATLRALRNLWGRVLKHCGLEADESAAWIHTTPSRRILTQRDPWVNQLRNTVCCFASAVAGADAITTLPHDTEFAEPSSFGNRVARNTQIVLSAESHLNKVIDAAGGAYFIETLTGQLSEAAWTIFTEIEGEGGMQAALEAGSIQQRIDNVADNRASMIAKRKQPITGVSEFANIGEDHLESPTLAEPQDARPNKPLTLPIDESLERILQASAEYTLSEVSTALLGSFSQHFGLPLRRDASAFEALRDRSDAYLEANGHRPTVWLACLGQLAEHNGRASFVRNLLNAGGIEACLSDAALSTEDQVRAFQESSTHYAIICGTDAAYGEQASPTATALKKAGATWVGLAGKAREELQTDGIDSFLHLGSNVLETLESLWTRMEDLP